MDEGSEYNGGIAMARVGAAAAAAAEGKKVVGMVKREYILAVDKAVDKLTVYGKVMTRQERMGDGGWTSSSRGNVDRKRFDKVAKE